MLCLPDSWVWDFWLVDHGTDYHMFFLFAPRALGDPEARHTHAAVGHAVSEDLRRWRRVRNALVPGPVGSFDELATWTGSVVRHPDGTWFMFYTGGRRTVSGPGQTIGYATSSDLLTWHKYSRNPVLTARSVSYDSAASGGADDAFRDPWVFADPDGAGWHMLITARGAAGPVGDRGVIGHATSTDLRRWTLQPPLSEPGAGFSQFEVIQVERVDGRWVLAFSCFGEDLAPTRRTAELRAGVWTAPAASPLGPFDIARAEPLTDETRYSGRLVSDRKGRWQLLTFRNSTEGRDFGGWIDDPMPVSWNGDTLVVSS